MALLVMTILLALGFVVVLVNTIVRAASAGPPPPPTVEARFRWREPPEVRLVTGNAPAAESQREPRADAPDAGVVVRWREEEKLRRVAGVLLLDGDYEGAMEILLQIKGEDSRAFALDRAAHAKILVGLWPALLDEREALKAFLLPQPVVPPVGPPASPREHVDGGKLGGAAGPSPRRSGFGRAGGRGTVSGIERFLTLPPEDFHLPQCAAALPERLALCFVRNVHVRLARATGGSDALLGLVLSLGFRQGSDAARVYWEEFPSERSPYPDALRASAGGAGKDLKSK
ncbi:MAG: hypothetical protein ACYTKD_13690 [Planctomycetota bacterium]